MDYLYAIINEVIDKLLEAKGYIYVKKTMVVKPQTKFLNNIIKFKDFIAPELGVKTGDLVETKKESSDEDMKGSVSFRAKENRFMGKFYYLGKRYSVYAQNETECWNKIRKKRKELKEEKKEENITIKNMTLNYWFDYYVENIKKPQIKESTYLRILEIYNRYLRKHEINNINIKTITAIKIQKIINGIPSHSPRKKIHQLLNEVFDMLQKMAIIKVNPMAVVILPRQKSETVIETNDNSKVLNYSDEVFLLDRIKKTTCYHAVKFILYSGLRRGECIGLQWKHINFENMTITINQQWNYNSKKITTTKSKAGNRVIPILPEAMEVLEILATTHHAEDDFIFKGINRLTQQLVFHSGNLPFKVNPHMLRHTFASRCYFAGLDPKRIQTLLGHENMSTTLDTYTHVLEKEDKEVIDRMKDFFKSINMID